MKSSKLRIIFPLFTALAVCGASLGIASVAQAKLSDDQKAALPQTSSNYHDLPACTSTITAFCVESYGIDLNSDGVFETPADDSPISLRAWLFNLSYDMPGLAWELLVNGSQELAPVIPAGTAATVRINTGQFKPTANMLSTARALAFSVLYENGSWITRSTFRADAYSVSVDCTYEQACETTKNQRDYGAFGQQTLFYEEPSPTVEAQHGMWVSSNANTIHELQFDRAELTWSVILVAPSKKKDGSPNEVFYETFLPDSAIAFSYGTTPDLLTKSLTVTRTDYDITRAVEATMTRVTEPVAGVLISIPDIRFYGKVVEKSGMIRSLASSGLSTNPKIRIAPRVAVLPQPKLINASASRQSARISGRPVPGARKYQAMCSRGAQSSLTTSKSPSITVKNLTPGKWRCQVRGVSALAGRWSDPKVVTIRK